MKPRIAVLASGSGTTAEAFIRAGLKNEIQTQVGLVISSREDSGVIERVNNLNKEHGLNIECLVINSSTHPAETHESVKPGVQTEAEETAILKALNDGNFDLVSLMGYMKRIGPRLVKAFGWRPEYSSIFQVSMVNTHPGLLPETKGLYGIHVQEHVLSEHLAYGGQSLHAIAKNYDEGPVIAEHRVEVMPDDTPETLFERVKAAEKKYLPKDIDHFIAGKHAFVALKKETASWQKS